MCELLVAVTSLVVKQGFSSAGSVAVHTWHVEPSWTRNQIRVAFVGRQILTDWTTRKVPFCFN